MSRYCNDYDNYYPDHWWRIDLQRALTSGRGQRILREIEDALRAMPDRRLIAGEIVEVGGWDDEGDHRIPTGAACAVGAYAIHRAMQGGKTREQAAYDLLEEYPYDPDEFDTQRLGQSVGLARTVAWHLGWLNDERFGHMKPRQRWRAMLRWVRSQIKPLDAARPSAGRGQGS